MCLLFLENYANFNFTSCSVNLLNLTFQVKLIFQDCVSGVEVVKRSKKADSRTFGQKWKSEKNRRGLVWSGRVNLMTKTYIVLSFLCYCNTVYYCALC